jgi:hypothetical protein
VPTRARLGSLFTPYDGQFHVYVGIVKKTLECDLFCPEDAPYPEDMARLFARFMTLPPRFLSNFPAYWALWAKYAGKTSTHRPDDCTTRTGVTLFHA